MAFIEQESAITQSKRFIFRFRELIQQRGYTFATERTYCEWVIRFIRYHGLQSEADFKVLHVEQYLSYLALERGLTINSQKTVLNALVFLYREFLGISVSNLQFSRSRSPKKLPVVLSPKEAKAIFVRLSGAFRLMTQLMFGTGLILSTYKKSCQISPNTNSLNILSIL